MSTSHVHDELTVVRQVRRSKTMQWLVNKHCTANLKSLLCFTGNQWSCLSTGVIWSRREAPVTSRAAAFCTDCSHWIIQKDNWVSSPEGLRVQCMFFVSLLILITDCYAERLTFAAVWQVVGPERSLLLVGPQWGWLVEMAMSMQLGELLRLHDILRPSRLSEVMLLGVNHCYCLCSKDMKD